MIIVGSTYKVDGSFGLGDLDPGDTAEFVGTSVEGYHDRSVFTSACASNGDCLVGRQKYARIEASVCVSAHWCDRSYLQDIEVRGYKRTAERIVISSRTHRRGDKDSVAGEILDLCFTDGNLIMGCVGERASYYDLVETCAHEFAAPCDDAGLHRGDVLDVIISLEYVFDSIS